MAQFQQLITFINISHKGKYALLPLINDLSDHDGQIIQLEIINMQNNQMNLELHETLTSTI